VAETITSSPGCQSARRGDLVRVRCLHRQQQTFDLLEVPPVAQGVSTGSPAPCSQGPIKNTARTACVVLAEGCSMPCNRETAIVRSEITGKVTSTSFMWRNCTFSLMVRSQAMWLNVLWIEGPRVHS